MSHNIPVRDLEEGLRIILENVNLLIETATFLHSEKRFLHSAVFSVFAIEELSKAKLVKAHWQDEKDLPRAEWKKITKGRGAHMKKWKDYLKSMKKTPSDVDFFRKHPEITEDVLSFLIADSNQRLKMGTLYVDWEPGLNPPWQWLPKLWSQNNQEEKCVELLNAAKKGYEEISVKEDPLS